MRSVLIRLSITMVLCVTIIAWYMIPDQFFVQGSSLADQTNPEVLQAIPANEEAEKVQEVELPKKVVA